MATDFGIANDYYYWPQRNFNRLDNTIAIEMEDYCQNRSSHVLSNSNSNKSR